MQIQQQKDQMILKNAKKAEEKQQAEKAAQQETEDKVLEVCLEREES